MASVSEGFLLLVESFNKILPLSFIDQEQKLELKGTEFSNKNTK